MTPRRFHALWAALTLGGLLCLAWTALGCVSSTYEQRQHDAMAIYDVLLDRVSTQRGDEDSHAIAPRQMRLLKQQSIRSLLTSKQTLPLVLQL
jgi:hypothetical protein